MQYKLTPADVAKVEKVVNSSGRTMAGVKLENGKLIVLHIEPKIVK